MRFDDISMDENITGFVCGSDTIFCIDEFEGFDDGYFANYDCMKKNSVAYAASFADSHFEQDDYQKLNERLKNFNAIGLRENQMIPYVASHVDVPVQRVIDPTLLLTSNEYDKIADERLENEKHAFRAVKDLHEYSCLVLIDDIYTTGATAESCTRALLEAGAGRVYLGNIAITMRGK